MKKKKFLSKSDEVKLVKLAQNDDKNALTILVENHIKMVYKEANRRRNRGVMYDDLVQEGVLGLMEAISKYDVTKGSRLTTYAFFWIKYYMDTAISKQSKSFNVPPYLSKRIKKYQKLVSNRENITTNQLTSELNISQLELTEVESLSNTEIDVEILSEVLSNNDEVFIDNNEIYDVIMSSINKLPKIQQEILLHRFGLCGDELPIEYISNKLNISLYEAKKEEVKAMHNLRFILSKNKIKIDY